MPECLPYGRQSIDEDDIQAVVDVLRSDWLTTGPKVAEFEQLFARRVGTAHAVAVTNGTAALHAAAHALGIGPGDEVLLPPMTFAATANVVVHQGGTPVFVDVEPETLLLDAERLEAAITPRTKAVFAVDYAGHPCDYDALRAITDRHGLALLADACHALGGAYKDRPVGSLADLSTFSFHPVKHITTGEGGMITTDDAGLADRMRTFRNHGISADFQQRRQQASWFYEIAQPGHNYRISDIHCALGISQMGKLSDWVAGRRRIARQYDEAFADIAGLTPLRVNDHATHAYHLYVVRADVSRYPGGRAALFAALRDAGVGANVHYIPVHLHPFYRRRFGTGPGLCPVAEAAYEQILSLPIFPGMSDRDTEHVIATLAGLMK